MEIVKTRDVAAVAEVSGVWAEAIAKRDDIDVDVAAATELVRKSLEASEHSFLMTVKDEAGELMAVAAIEPERDTADDHAAELRYIGVAPGHWGEGWARRLLVALPDAMREEGYDHAVLWVYADNTRAIWVYESLAWSATDEHRPHEVTGRVERKYRINL